MGKNDGTSDISTEGLALGKNDGASDISTEGLALLATVGLAEGLLVGLIDGDKVGASVTEIVGLAEGLFVDGDGVGASVTVGSAETGDALAVVTSMEVEGGNVSFTSDGGISVSFEATGGGRIIVSFLDDKGSSVSFKAEGGRTGIIDGDIVGDTSATELTSMGEAIKAPVKLTHRFSPSS